jgi:hypothetical protein
MTPTKSLRKKPLKKKPLFLSWLQLRKERARLLVAIAGISFADVLMFLQMGFRGALFSSAVEFHHSLNGEIVMVSGRYRSLISLDRFTERRLYQAVGVRGVESVSPVYLNFIQWRNPDNKAIWDIYAIGINPEHQVMNLAGVESNRQKLREPDTVLFTAVSEQPCHRLKCSKPVLDFVPQLIFVAGLISNCCLMPVLGVNLARSPSISTPEQPLPLRLLNASFGCGDYSNSVLPLASMVILSPVTSIFYGWYDRGRAG